MQASERFVEDLFLAAWQSAVAKNVRFLAEEAAQTWVGVQNYQHGSSSGGFPASHVAPDLDESVTTTTIGLPGGGSGGASSVVF